MKRIFNYLLVAASVVLLHHVSRLRSRQNWRFQLILWLSLHLSERQWISL